MYRLDFKTLFTVRYWERYKFLIDYEHKQASPHPVLRVAVAALITRMSVLHAADDVVIPAHMLRVSFFITAQSNSSEEDPRHPEAGNRKEDRKQFVLKGKKEM